MSLTFFLKLHPMKKLFSQLSSYLQVSNVNQPLIQSASVNLPTGKLEQIFFSDSPLSTLFKVLSLSIRLTTTHLKFKASLIVNQVQKKLKYMYTGRRNQIEYRLLLHLQAQMHYLTTESENSDHEHRETVALRKNWEICHFS